MKTKSLITAIALLYCSLSAFAGNSIDDLSKSIAQIPHAEHLNVNSLTLGLIKPFAPELKGVNNVEILNAENISNKDYTRLQALIAQCNTSEYETLVSSNDNDEIARILMKTEKEKIREMVIISLEKDEISLIRIKGKIDPKQMEELVKDKK